MAKYKIEDTIFFIWQNRIEKGVITVVDEHTTAKDQSTTYMTSADDMMHVHENDAFSSPEELLEHLKTDWDNRDIF